MEHQGDSNRVLTNHLSSVGICRPVNGRCGYERSALGRSEEGTKSLGGVYPAGTCTRYFMGYPSATAAMTKRLRFFLDLHRPLK